jgi:prepilin-type N-terminal cleavage/methylation domain-containing protein
MALEHQDGRETRRSRRALTLLELLVVLAIIGLLLAVLFPAIQALRESARKTACMNNLEHVGRALQQYSNKNYGQLPPGWIADDDAGYPGWGWGALILNELGYPSAAHEMAAPTHSKAAKTTNAPKSKKARGKDNGRGKSKGKAVGKRDIDEAAPEFLTQQFSVYLCPSDLSQGVTFELYEDPTSFPGQDNGPPNDGNGKPGNGKPGNGNGPGNGSPPANGSNTGRVLLTVSRSSYAGVFGAESKSNPAVGDGAFYENSETSLASLDGKTLLVGERDPRQQGTWTGAVPGAVRSRELVIGGAFASFGSRFDFGSNHDAVCFVFASGSASFLSNDLDRDVYQAMMSRTKED